MNRHGKKILVIALLAVALGGVACRWMLDPGEPHPSGTSSGVQAPQPARLDTLAVQQFWAQADTAQIRADWDGLLGAYNRGGKAGGEGFLRTLPIRRQSDLVAAMRPSHIAAGVDSSMTPVLPHTGTRTSPLSVQATSYKQVNAYIDVYWPLGWACRFTRSIIWGYNGYTVRETWLQTPTGSCATGWTYEPSAVTSSQAGGTGYTWWYSIQQGYFHTNFSTSWVYGFQSVYPWIKLWAYQNGTWSWDYGIK